MKDTWSKRFDQGLNPFIEEFNASINFDIELFFEDIEGSISHAKMLERTSVISQDDLDKIESGLISIRQEFQDGLIKFSIEDEDIHFGIEKKLIEKIGDVGKKLHTGRSRNDQVATDIRLWVRKKIVILLSSLNELQKSLFNHAENNLYTLVPGYTHLQRAQPLSLSHYLLAYIEMFERDKERLLETKKRVNISPLGSAALAGTNVPIDREYTAKLLNFSDYSRNSLDAVSDRDFVVEFISHSSIIMAHLSRLSEEIILWSSDEFSFISLTDRCSTGSSLMPQKKNPDVPELIRGKSGRVFGNLISILTIIKGLPLAYNKDLQEDKESVFDTFITVNNSLKAMTILFEEGLVFSSSNLESAVHSDYSNATDVADYLVKKGVPFREAYQLVGELIKECLEKNLLLKEITMERWHEFHPFIAEDIYKKISPKEVVASRISEGGTGFQRVKEQITYWRKKLEK